MAVSRLREMDAVPVEGGRRAAARARVRVAARDADVVVVLPMPPRRNTPRERLL